MIAIIIGKPQIASYLAVLRSCSSTWPEVHIAYRHPMLYVHNSDLSFKYIANLILKHLHSFYTVFYQYQYMFTKILFFNLLL